MELRERVTRARIVTLANISGSFGVSPPLGGSLVASQLGHGGTTGGELEEFTRGRRVVQMSVLIAGRAVGTGSN